MSSPLEDLLETSFLDGKHQKFITIHEGQLDGAASRYSKIEDKFPHKFADKSYHINGVMMIDHDLLTLSAGQQNIVLKLAQEKMACLGSYMIIFRNLIKNVVQMYLQKIIPVEKAAKVIMYNFARTTKQFKVNTATYLFVASVAKSFMEFVYVDDPTGKDTEALEALRRQIFEDRGFCCHDFNNRIFEILQTFKLSAVFKKLCVDVSALCQKYLKISVLSVPANCRGCGQGAFLLATAKT